MAFWTWSWLRTVAARPAFFRATATVRSRRLPPPTTGASQVGSVAIGDFDGDGFPDIATTSAPDNSIYILLNKATTATPSFQAPVQYVQTDGTPAPGPSYLTIGA